MLRFVMDKILIGFFCDYLLLAILHCSSNLKNNNNNFNFRTKSGFCIYIHVHVYAFNIQLC